MFIPVLNKHYSIIPEGAAYIGRPSPWGNPFSHLKGTQARYQVDTREEAVERYRFYLEQRLEDEPTFLDPLLDAPALVCWCAPRSCHGDVIAEFIQLRRTELGLF